MAASATLEGIHRERLFFASRCALAVSAVASRPASDDASVTVGLVHAKGTRVSENRARRATDSRRNIV